MLERIWVSETRKTLVCIDSYDNGVPKGRIYNPCMEAEGFESLSQLLIKMEALLDELQIPQSYTTPRSFSGLVVPLENQNPEGYIRKGVRTTFELQVIFRQHTSWQGVIRWREQHREQSFRSVLELILLMDSALRGLEGSDVA